MIGLKPLWKKVNMTPYDIPEILTSRGFTHFDSHVIDAHGNSWISKGGKMVGMKPFWKEVLLDTYDVPEILTSRWFTHIRIKDFFPIF